MVVGFTMKQSEMVPGTLLRAGQAWAGMFFEGEEFLGCERYDELYVIVAVIGHKVFMLSVFGRFGWVGRDTYCIKDAEVIWNERDFYRENT